MSPVLSIDSVRQHDDGDIYVTVSVTNCDRTAIGWDSDFSTFFQWELRGANGQPLRGSLIESLLKPQREGRDRFVMLAAGQELRQELNITRGFTAFYSAHGISGDGLHFPTGYEQLVRYPIERIDEIARIELSYGPQYDDLGGFYVFFGFDAKDVGLWLKPCRASWP